MTQLALLFEPPPPRSYAPARAAGERAGHLAAGKAERLNDGFSERAAQFICGYLAQHGVSSGEMVTDAAKLAGIVPPDDRAFGPVYAKLLRDKKVRVTGVVARMKGHGCLGAKTYELA